jgi:capsule biosynthesis phosphatase
MIVIIPLGGIGERFKKNAYNKPKALINVFGKPILFYLLDNLNLSNIDYVIIPYNKEYENYRLEDQILKEYPNIKFIFINLLKNTEGAAETINIALSQLKIEDCPILCLDGDNFYTVDIIKLWEGKNMIYTIQDNSESAIYSYINIDNNGIITNIVEKEKISKNACTGAYGFNSWKELNKYCKIVIDSNIRQKGEFYTSNVIKQMINENNEFLNKTIKIENWHCLGTPIQVRQFCNNFPSLSCLDNKQKIKKLRICFDFDNTLVTFPKKANDYTTVEPIKKNIEFLKYLKSFGHEIIIYTARKMSSMNGNLGKVNASIGKITFDTLEKFDIPYDEIYFGKPNANIYIDDLGLNCYENLEKELGFYMDKINTRDFNELKSSVIETFKKSSTDLSGEIYYYNNIPKNIKDLFPIMIDYDMNNTWYSMEKIHGISVSSLYLSENLSKDILVHILNSVKRIQNSIKLEDLKQNSYNIYSNYSLKLKSRYQSYDYEIFKESDKFYTYLLNELEKYEKNNLGRISVIHGDSVFTNIILNTFGKIKFIDMRGKIGDQLSICGDWLYDWAKIYQSLIGYDKILLNKELNKKYEESLIDCFINYFLTNYSQEDFNNLKIITKSLLFTLIPLHKNNKCLDYYNLAKNSEYLN